jgi:predicted enzyme related to lactoylglutathione lyase
VARSVETVLVRQLCDAAHHSGSTWSIYSASVTTRAEGGLPGVGLHVDDCRKTYQELSANGVVFIQEPQERPYGVEALMRDNSGNWLVLVEPREFTEADFEESGLH